MSDILVETNDGVVKGILTLDYRNNKYYSFFGIPYARPPVGCLRFKAPEHPEKWNGIKDCTAARDSCISRHTLTAKITGTEDCLYLNVYTRKLPNEQTAGLKPVLFWIHGGAFTSGSGNPDIFGPDFLITQDIVIVTINYRVGPLGFLCLEDESLEVPGNAGIKDAVMALKWVNKNISDFNGDANNVTIAGQSSGAIIVNFLILTPLCTGLFHKAIMQSATALQSWALGKRECAHELAEVLGLKSHDEKEILDFLRQVPAFDLLKASEKIRKLSNNICADRASEFNPVIEKSDDHAVLTEEPIITMLRGNYTKVPMLMGYTSAEGLYSIFIIKNKKIIVKDFERMIPYTFKLSKGSSISKLTAEKIKRFYFGNEEATAENKDKYMKMASFLYFSYPVCRSAKNFLKNLGHPIYFYKFSVDAKLNIYKLIRKYEAPGASHGDDTSYLFKTILTPTITPGSIEDLTIERMTNLWGNFIKTGNPNDINRTTDISWAPIQADAMHYLDITNNGLVMSTNPDIRDVEFWDDIYKLQPHYFANKL